MGGLLSWTIRNITVRFFRFSGRRIKYLITPVQSPVIAFPVFPYGRHPVSNSITVHSSDQVPDLVDAPLSSMASGAIQVGLPATSLISRSIARKLSETPNSDSFTFLVFVVRMFTALRSECTTSL